MPTYVVSGAASGIGKATTEFLRERGHKLVTVDLHDTDVVADLSTPEGRASAVETIRATAGAVHGVVPCAGIAGTTAADGSALVSVNYFGALALVRGLRDLMPDGGAVVLLASNSITCQPGWDTSVAEACLAGDEALARERAAATEAVHVYPATKAALATWQRREAVAWAKDGIRLNAVAPGLVATPMTDQLREDPVLGEFVDAYPSALDRPGRADEVAAAIGFLLSGAASLVVGSVLYVDGGTDALLNPG